MKIKNPEISIIIPVYGVEDYIARCITSVMQQTFTNFECLIIDDGSVDQSVAITKKIINGDERFVVIHKSNGGQGSARNLGLDRAKGRYIAFIDSDDYVESNYLEALYNTITKEQADICVCNTNYVNDGLQGQAKPLKQFNSNISAYYKTFDFLNAKGYISNFMWDKLYAKSCFESIRFDESMRTSEDVFIVFKLLFNKKIVATPQYLYNYVQRAGSTSKGVHPTFFTDRHKIITEQIEFSKKNNLYNKYYSYIIYTYINNFVFFCLYIFARYSENKNKNKNNINVFKSAVDKKIFNIKNIINLIRSKKINNKRGVALLVFFISPSVFRLLVRYWFRNHS